MRTLVKSALIAEGFLYRKGPVTQLVCTEDTEYPERNPCHIVRRPITTLRRDIGEMNASPILVYPLRSLSRQDNPLTLNP